MKLFFLMYDKKITLKLITNYGKFTYTEINYSKNISKIIIHRKKFALLGTWNFKLNFKHKSRNLHYVVIRIMKRSFFL